MAGLVPEAEQPVLIFRVSIIAFVSKPLPSFIYAQAVLWQVPLDAVGCTMSKRVLSLPACRMSLIWVIVVERRAVKK